MRACVRACVRAYVCHNPHLNATAVLAKETQDMTTSTCHARQTIPKKDVTDTPGTEIEPHNGIVEREQSPLTTHKDRDIYDEITLPVGLSLCPTDKTTANNTYHACASTGIASSCVCGDSVLFIYQMELTHFHMATQRRDSI